MNQTGSGLVYSTIIGGNNSDISNSITTDSGGKAYITGYTCSTDYPVTSDALFSKNSGDEDIFLTIINETASRFDFSTCYGGQAQDNARDIKLDKDNSIYITGVTESSDFPYTYNAIVSNEGEEQEDTFILKFSPIYTNLNITSPNGGEIWMPNTEYDITWTTEDISKVNIYFSSDNGLKWLPIAEDIDASTGKYRWTVPDIHSQKCLIKITDTVHTTQLDRSNTVFMISQPFLHIITPNGGICANLTLDKKEKMQ
jgi:hypothetical protein